MSQHELDLIEKLSARSAEPRTEFAIALRDKLLNRERILRTNIKPLRRNAMNVRKLTFGLASFVLLAGATILVLAVKFNTDNEAENTAQTTSTASDLAQTTSLPNQEVGSLEEAKKSLTFTPLLPSRQINSEDLTNIKVGTRNNMLDDSDTLYLTYSDGQSSLYKISQSTKSFSYPADTEKVTFQISGAPVTADFYQLAEEQSESINSAGYDVSSPTSYMFWNMNGVNYEISEFGRVAKSQLVDIASSFK